MNPRTTLLLSAYRLPTETTLYLSDEEMAAFLNAWRVLWHPAVLACSEALPRIASPYDHEQPTANLLISVPDNPPLTLPDDWFDRARAAGAVVFYAHPQWDSTLANLRQALQPLCAEREYLSALLDLPPEAIAGFYALGLGVGQLDALFEAMQQENLLNSGELVEAIAQAVEALSRGQIDLVREKLQAAASLLLKAREVIYPTSIHVIDLVLELAADWPAAFAAELPVNFLASGQQLEALSEERLAILKPRVANERAEVISGGYREREEYFLPLESQLANLRLAQQTHQRLFETPLRVYGRRRGGLHTQMPMLLQSSGITRCLFVSFDESMLPSHSSAVVSWPSTDGKQVDAFTRMPQPAHTPQTYFHLAHLLYTSIVQDQNATIALMHREQLAPVWYHDWVELTRLAPVLGRWTTLSNYFNEVMTGDYTSVPTADEFYADFLIERTTSTPQQAAQGQTPRPISEFATLHRERRTLDATFTFAGLLHALQGPSEPQPLSELEERFEKGQANSAELQAALNQAARRLAERLVARGAEQPGWLVLNPCAFTRRVALELLGVSGAIQVEGPVKASQLDGDLARVVVEVPALGFAWFPRPAPGTLAPPSKLKTAEERTIRNEFFEAEIDPQTGGLRNLRDSRTRIGRVAQQLVWNPGSTMRASSVAVTACGPALGEITTAGELLDGEGKAVVRFRQRFRAWIGRPVLELRIELEPLQPIEGYAWHAYVGSRLAWREEMTPLLRGYQGQPIFTSSNRPESPDFLELRVGRPNTVVLPGGLPFHQRHGGRMVDTLLLVEGESARTFDLMVGLDREVPMQTALGVVSPVAVVETTKGPPPVRRVGCFIWTPPTWCYRPCGRPREMRCVSPCWRRPIIMAQRCYVVCEIRFERRSRI
ncbi:MAG: hypothetical protein SNJ82_08835 [Gemmataceae bacterium]